MSVQLLYSAARRAAFTLGYRRIITYTLAEEHGTSLRASGYTLEAEIKGESWKRRGRWSVDDRNPIGDKKRWSAGEKCELELPRFDPPLVELPLFADASDPHVTDTGKLTTREKASS